MNARRSPVHAAWGLAVLAIFAGGAVLWRAAHRERPAERMAPPTFAAAPAAEPVVPAIVEVPAPVASVRDAAEPTVRSAGPAATPAAARVPPSAAGSAAVVVDERPAPGAGRDAGRDPLPNTERWHRQQYLAQAATDPAGFADGARKRLDADAPLAEKVALLQAAREADPVLADSLYASALDFNGSRDPALREAAANLLLRDLQKPRSDPATWNRLRAFALGGARPVDPLRARVAGALYAAAPEGQLDRLALEAERDADPAFLQAAWRGLSRNPATRAQDLAADLARRNARLAMLESAGGELAVE